MNQKAKYANFAEELRDKVIFILYAALILKFIARFVPALNFFSTIVIAIFFLFELFLLNPLSLVVMSIVVGLMFYILPVIVEFLLGMVVGSFILLIVAAGICYLLSSVIITVVWGVIVSVQVSIFSAPLAFAGGITMATVGLGTLLGAGEMI